MLSPFLSAVNKPQKGCRKQRAKTLVKDARKSSDWNRGCKSLTVKDMAPHTSEEISSAIQQGLPVVALESTLIAHGLPWPDNLQLAQDVEEIVRAEGAVPATIGIINGTVKVGLSSSDLELMASEQKVVKVSRRDLAVVQAKGLHGATTVAATLHLAIQTGIKVLATGGIGGVHR